MRRIFIQNVVLLSFLAASTAALAAQKLPQDSVSRVARCDWRLLHCTCNHLIDLGTAIADCEKECVARHKRCIRWAAGGSKPARQ